MTSGTKSGTRARMASIASLWSLIVMLIYRWYRWVCYRRRCCLPDSELDGTDDERGRNAPHGSRRIPRLPGDIEPGLSQRVVLHDVIADENPDEWADRLDWYHGPHRR